MTDTKQSAIEAVKTAFFDEWPCLCATEMFCRPLSPHEIDEDTIDACFHAALIAFRQWLEDEGLVVVPREATYKMMVNGQREMEAAEDPNSDGGYASDIYRAMIAAAPDTLGETK
jgi:hypothetical protein